MSKAKTKNKQALNEFAKKQWEKTLAYLQSNFSLSRDDCEDIFQDSFITLHENILSGKLKDLTSSLSTYFTGICRNKAYEYLRQASKELPIFDEFDAQRVDRLLGLDDSNDKIEQSKSDLVRYIVKNLPEPCNSLLWGFYRDGFSMKTLASMLNYSSESSVKVTKHRCCEKFRKRYQELVKKIL